MITAAASSRSTHSDSLAANPGLPANVREACELREQYAIAKKEWDAMSKEHQALVTKSLAKRGLKLFSQSKGQGLPARLIAGSTSWEGTPVSIKQMDFDGYEFMVAGEDPRIPDNNDVSFYVRNTTTREEAAERLKSFLKDLFKNGYEIERE